MADAANAAAVGRMGEWGGGGSIVIIDGIEGGGGKEREDLQTPSQARSMGRGGRR